MTISKLVTRCPACRTAFRVVADQLRLRQGLVRCGQCHTVFDANANMVALPGQPAPAAMRPAAPDAAIGADAGADMHAPAGKPASTGQAAFSDAASEADVAIFVPGVTSDDEAPGAGHGPASDDPGYDVPALDAPTMMMSYPRPPEPAAPVQPPSPPPPPVSSSLASPATRVQAPGDVLNASGFLRAQAADDVPGASSGHARDAAYATPPRATADIHGIPDTHVTDQPGYRDDLSVASPATSQTASLAESGHAPRAPSSLSVASAAPASYAPEILRRNPPAAGAAASAVPRWRRPAVSVLLALLAVTALAQAAMLFRADLAGRYPYLRPLLEAACEPFGCAVPPWRDIEALRIDTSQLQKQDEGSDEYLLAVTLRNQGRASVALPAIELVMTDLQDQLLLRRVLQPADYLAQDQSPFARRGLVAGMELPVRVRFRTQQTAANYRVLIFYP